MISPVLLDQPFVDGEGTNGGGYVAAAHTVTHQWLVKHHLAEVVFNFGLRAYIEPWLGQKGIEFSR